MKLNRTNPLFGRLFAGNTLTTTLVITLTALFHPASQAANLTWDANGPTADVTNGAGNWDTSSVNWWDGSTNVTWTDGNTAVIGANPVSGAGGTINFAEGVDISVLGLTVADNANATNHTIAPPITGSMVFTVGTGGITANDGITITQPFFMGGNQAWTRSATGNGALTITGSVDDNFIPRALSLSSALGSSTVGIVLRGALFHDGTTAIGDGYFQVRHDSFGQSAITLNGTIGGAQRIQFINAAGTGSSGTLANPISLGNGKEGNIYIWGGFTTTVQQPITGGDASSVLRKTDAGTLLLENDNTYTGATIVDTGTLQLGSGGVTGAIGSSASLAINGSAVVDIRRSGTTSLSDLFPGAAGALSATFGGNDARLNFTGAVQSDTLTIDQDLGTDSANGQLRVSAGTMTLASGTDLALRSLSVGHTTAASGNVGTLNVGTGVNATVSPTTATAIAAINLGDSNGNAGIMNMTGGTVTTNSNATGSIRVGHWAGTGSTLNISGGTLSTPNGRIAIGWDGEGTLNLSGGTLSAFAVSIDGNGAGPTSVANLTGGDLRIGGNGMSTAGQGSIVANGGKITSTASNTLTVPRSILAGGLTAAFGSATTNITITDNCVTTGSGPLTILNESATGEKNYTINTSSPTYSGAVSVPSGVRLQLQQPTALGTGTATLVSGSGAFLTSSAASYPTNFILSGNGWVEPASTLAYGALRLQTATVSGNVAIAAGGARISAHNGSNGTITGNLTGSSPLEINSTQASNNGTVTLAGNGTGFTGAITVPQGRLNVSGSVGGNVSTIDGATLGGEGSIGGNLTLGGTTPATLNIDPTTSAALAVTGNVTLTGANSLSFTPPPTTVGAPIKVFSYSGTLTGTPGTDLVLANAASYRTASWSNTGGVVSLTLSNKNLSWTGSAGGTWDVGTTASWSDGSPSTFYWADNVTFPDSGANTAITIASPAAPASMTFPANTALYTITASGVNQLTGNGALLKSGTALLTLSGANAYTGGSTLSKGETRVQTAGALGTATVTLGNASTGADNVSLYLDTNRVSFGTPVVVSNNGTGTMTLGSRSTVTGSGDNNQFTNITLQRDVIFDANAADRTDFETISGTGNITINGTGRALFMTANTFTGNVTINNTNTLGLQIGTNSTAFNAIPDASNVTINAGSTMALSFTAGGSETIGGLSGAGTVRQNGGSANTLIVGSGNANGSFSGAINNVGGAISFSKTGTGTQTLSGTNSAYTGVTTITAGVLEAAALANGGTNSSIGASTNAATNLVFGAATATLRYTGNTDVTTDRGFTLSSGTSNAGATLESSGTGAWTIPAAVAIGYGTVDQARALTLGGAGAGANTFAGTIANNGTGVTTVNKTGTGTWALTSNNSFTGPLNINGGRLNLSFIGNGGAASQVGQSTKAGTNLALNGGTLAYTGITATTDRAFSTGASGGTIEVPTGITLTFGSASSVFALGGTLTKTGAGTLSLSTYTGSSAAAASDIVINNGVVNFGTGYFNASPFGYRTLAITVNSGGILRLSAGHSLGGDNIEGGTSLGQIRVVGGQLQVNGSQYLSSGLVSGEGRLVLDGGTVNGSSDLRSVPNGAVITSLASSATSSVLNTGGISTQYGPLLFDVADGSATTDLAVGGPIASPAASTNTITKSGAGLMTLAGTSTYTGPTAVNGGTLSLGGSIRSTSGVTVASGTLMEVSSINPFTTGHGAAEVATQGIQVNGGTLRFTSSSEARLGNIGLNGGTLTSNRGSGFGNGYDIYLGALDSAAEATVSVTGSTDSTTNSLRFNEAGAKTLTLAGTNTLTSGGVLVTSTVGANTTTITGGTLVGANTLDLILHQNNASGTLAINSIIANNTGATGLTKTGAGAVTLGGANTYSGTTRVFEGKLTVTGNNGGKIYEVGSQGRLEIGYAIGQVYNYGVTVNGNGVSSTNGLALDGGKTYTFSSTVRLAGAPSTVRSYGTGNATLGGYDTNSTHLAVENTASGSVIDSTVNFVGLSFGYVMNIAPGLNTATGDVTLLGTFSGGTPFRKSGLGSVRLAGSGSSSNTGAFEVRQGLLIIGNANNRLGTGSNIVLGNGTDSGTLVLAGVNQTVTAVTTSGTGTANAIVGGSATASTLTINNTSATTLSANLGGTGTNHNNLVLAKSAAGVLTVSGANTYTGGTSINAGTLSLGSLGALGTAGTISLNGGALQFTANNTTDYTASGRLKLEDGVSGVIDTNGQNVEFASPLAVGGLGTGGLGKSGTGGLTLSANQVYTGATSVNAGTLTLNYASANGSKLSDTGVLTLAGGALDLAGGSHQEVVASTQVTGISTISRSSGSATINLGDITRTGSNTLNILGDNIAKTSLANDLSGKLPSWITVNGSPCANDGSGNIVTFSGFYNITRLGGLIPNNPANNVQIVNGGSFGDITTAVAGLTDISTLIQGASAGPAIVSLSGSDTLRLGAVGAIQIPGTSGSLTIQGGYLTAGGADDTAGDIAVDAVSDLTLATNISNNGTGAVSLSKTGSGALILTEVSDFTGGITLNAGQLRIDNALGLGLGALTINGGSLDNTSGLPVTIGDTIPQFWNADINFVGSNDLLFGPGVVTLGGNRNVNVAASTLRVGGSLNGAFSLNKTGAGTLIVAGGNWSGTTTVSSGILEVNAKSGDVPYVVASGATLKLGYTTGTGYANTNLKITGDGTAATTGLYLKGSASYNTSGTIELLAAPTTIRHEGSGMAQIGHFDINGTGLSTVAASSGSIIDADIEIVSKGYGMSVNIASGAATATGDLVINGRLNVGNGGFYKRGAGSVALNAAATGGNLGLRIEGGSVITGIANAIGSNAALTVSSGAKLVMNGFSQSASTLSGAGSIVNNSGTPAVLSVSQAADGTFSGVVGGSTANERNLSLVKSGSNKLTLSGANTYTGDTTVNAGTLSLANAYLADSSDVILATGAVIELTTATTDTIDELILDGTPQVAGVYGAVGSGAQFERSYITGTGTLTVTTGPAGYSSWETANGITGAGPAADSDNDGIPNGIEFVIGGDPSGPGSDSSALLPTITVDANYLNFTFRRTSDSVAYDPFVEYGSTLTGWTPAEGGVNGVIINETADFYGTGTDQVVVKIPKAGSKLFARLRVDIAP